VADPRRGEVWIVDLGMAAKVRPCLVLSIPALDQDLKVPFLRVGAFDAQSLVTIPHAKLVRRIGTLVPSQWQAVETVVRKWLGFEGAKP